MIPRAHIVAWSNSVDWPTDEQIEQDLLLSRLIVEIANDPYLRDELVFRGGTCLHKLHLSKGLRYSEDLDYVRRTGGGIAQMVQALREIGERLAMDVKVRMDQQPKVIFRAPFESGVGTMRVKIEVNTYERFPARDLIRLPYEVDSNWFTGTVNVQTFELAELMATKIRALYQRRKGRDLFDLWLALTTLDLDPADVIDSFEPYRPDGYTGAQGRRTLEDHVGKDDFRHDLNQLVRNTPEAYDVDEAARMVTGEILDRL